MTTQYTSPPRRYAVGERVPQGGRYAIFDARGERVRKVLVTDAGQSFPEIEGVVNAQFELIELIQARFSTSGTANVVTTTAASYGQLMDNLAKR